MQEASKVALRRLEREIRVNKALEAGNYPIQEPTKEDVPYDFPDFCAEEGIWPTG